MDVRIEINCDGAAFDDPCGADEPCGAGAELARIFREIAAGLECDPASLLRADWSHAIMDVNGNRVGSFKVLDH